MFPGFPSVKLLLCLISSYWSDLTECGLGQDVHDWLLWTGKVRCLFFHLQLFSMLSTLLLPLRNVDLTLYLPSPNQEQACLLHNSQT